MKKYNIVFKIKKFQAQSGWTVGNLSENENSEHAAHSCKKLEGKKIKWTEAKTGEYLIGGHLTRENCGDRNEF